MDLETAHEAIKNYCLGKSTGWPAPMDILKQFAASQVEAALKKVEVEDRNLQPDDRCDCVLLDDGELIEGCGCQFKDFNYANAVWRQNIAAVLEEVKRDLK